ncbi:MAG: class I SAM-dependent methyltransferase [Candidatus Kerfeldbacteria bacterium]|nr:class I SAM-dependent methyltransferase [Candidatus Kerfeldbacteria bacterium]
MTTIPCPICGQPSRRYYAATTDDPTRLYQPANFQCTSINVRDHGPIFRCSSCRVGFIWPQPTSRQLEALYTTGQDKAYLTDDRSRRETSDRIIRRFLGEGSGRTVLDVGCHTGLFLDVARQYGWRSLGVEPNAWARAYAKKHFGIAVAPTIEQLPAQSFDAITLFDVIEHVPKPTNFLRRLRDFSKPATQLVISTPNFDAPLARLLRARWYCIRQQHLFYFTEQSLRHLMQMAGWRLVDRHPFSRAFTLASWNDRVQKFFPPAGAIGRLLIHPWQTKCVTIPLGDEMIITGQPL